MQLQTSSSLSASAAIRKAQLVRAHEEREPRPIRSGSASADARARTQGEAAVLHFGAEAREQAQQHEDSGDAGPEPSAGDPGESLSPEQQRAVDDLRKRDREVRTHEQTHRSAGGRYAGAIHLDYEQGPDGRRYAVAGSTPIDVSPVPSDPAATLRKMETVRSAATAPANPSAADQQVAAEASQQAQRARAELAAQRYGAAQELAPEAGPATRSDAGQQPAHAPSLPSGKSGAEASAPPSQHLALRV